jgi:hypothetical protein
MPEHEDRRECIVVNYDQRDKGVFVKYAPIEFRDDGNQPYVAEKAIVELDDGRVVTVDPGQVRFKPKST